MSCDKLTEALNTTREKLKAARAATGELLSAIERAGGVMDAAAVRKWLMVKWQNHPGDCGSRSNIPLLYAARNAIIQAVIDEAVAQGGTVSITRGAEIVERLVAKLRDITKTLLPPEPAEITIDQAVGRLSGGSMSAWRDDYGELLAALGDLRKHVEAPGFNQMVNRSKITRFNDAIMKLRAPEVLGELLELREFKRRVQAAAQ